MMSDNKNNPILTLFKGFTLHDLKVRYPQNTRGMTNAIEGMLESFSTAFRGVASDLGKSTRPTYKRSKKVKPVRTRARKGSRKKVTTKKELTTIQRLLKINAIGFIVTIEPRNNIDQPPGSLVLKVTEFLCSKKVYERVFQQNIISMREEYFDALAEGREEKAKWIKIRGYLWMIWTVALQIFEFVVSGPVKIIKGLWG